MVIKRDRYLQHIIARKHNGLVKVITGIRRCGFTLGLSPCPSQFLRTVIAQISRFIRTLAVPGAGGGVVRFYNLCPAQASFLFPNLETGVIGPAGSLSVMRGSMKRTCPVTESMTVLRPGCRSDM